MSRRFLDYCWPVFAELPLHESSDTAVLRINPSKARRDRYKFLH